MVFRKIHASAKSRYLFKVLGRENFKKKRSKRVGQRLFVDNFDDSGAYNFIPCNDGEAIFVGNSSLRGYE